MKQKFFKRPIALANDKGCDHMNQAGTFKGGFDGCVLHMMSCEGHSKESATKICGKIAATVANAFDPDQTRSSAGTFSADARDASSAAHQATAEAHDQNTAEAHQRAARLHRAAARRHDADGNAGMATMHEGMAKGHDALAQGCANCLPNDFLFAEREGDRWRFALENDGGIDDDGWALIAPFGEHPKTRLFRDGAQVKEQHFIQVLDNESADALLAKDNTLFGKLKRAIIGVPVFKGHGDLNDADPKAVANDKEKIKLGVVDKIRKSERGIEAHFALDNDGAVAVAAGWKFPSAFWWVLPAGMRALSNGLEAIVARPFKLISVALTQYPNISSVESLANARSAAIAAASHVEQKPTPEPEMKRLAGWLIAQGATSLANAAEPTEQQVLDAMQSVLASKAGEATALGNEKTSLTGQITTLTTDRDAHKKRADENKVALDNAATRTKTLLGHIVDVAIGKGIKTVAERDATITALENSVDAAKDITALLETAPTHKTAGSGLDMSGKQQAALSNEQVALQNEYQQAFQAELIAAGQDPVKAHRNIMTLPKYAGLAAKLVPKGS